jgi:hypothetical protein
VDASCEGKEAGIPALLSDRWRPAVALGSVLALCAMGLHYADLVADRSDWLGACQAAPGSCEGRRAFLALVDVIEVEPGSFTVMKVTTPVRLEGGLADLKVGETVSVEARFGPEGLEVVQMERHPYRKLKKILGFVGMSLAGVAAGVGWRWEGGLRRRG